MTHREEGDSHNNVRAVDVTGGYGSVYSLPASARRLLEFGMPDSGSRLGAAKRRQVRSDAAIVVTRRPMTCGNAAQRRLRRPERSVRIEGVRGSNPLSSTQPQVRGRLQVGQSRSQDHLTVV